jgi:hypothetical protein
MEFLNSHRNKIWNLARRSDMANSPFHKAIQGLEDKRSKLFPDRRRVPGRCLSKFNIKEEKENFL